MPGGVSEWDGGVWERQALPSVGWWNTAVTQEGHSTPGAGPPPAVRVPGSFEASPAQSQPPELASAGQFPSELSF